MFFILVESRVSVAMVIDNNNNNNIKSYARVFKSGASEYIGTPTALMYSLFPPQHFKGSEYPTAIQ